MRKESMISKVTIFALVVLAIGGWTVTRAQVPVIGPPPTPFELDGDIHDDPVGGQNDWENCNCTSPPAIGVCNASATTANAPGGSAVVPDGAGATVYTIGSTKDFNDVSVWHFKKYGSVPDKDDIINAYALQYLVPDANGDKLLYVGGERFDNSGSAFIGAWFFQNAITMDDATGNFVGVHKNGDILILAEFNKGGTNGTVKVYAWVGTGGTPADTCAELGGTPNAKHPETLCDIPGGDFASGRQNGPLPNGSGPQTIPETCRNDWPYTNKAGVRGVIPENDFFEVGINLTALHLAAGCYPSFLLETRSSFEVDAILKDFVLHSFEQCSTACNKTASANVCEGGAITFTHTASASGAPLTVTLSDDNGNYASDDDICITGADASGACITKAKGSSDCPTFELLPAEPLSCTRSVSNLPPGVAVTNTETLTVTYPGGVPGCTAAATATIFPNPDVSINSVACNASGGGSNIQLTASVREGTYTGVYSCSWTKDGLPFATTCTISVSSWGTYEVTVKDSASTPTGGCTGSATRKVGLCTD